jgi:cytosine/adenosine deaminase-related metal-dependent hydrolase
MSRKVYDDGQLVEEWDDDTTTYRRFDDGEVVEERPYSVTEAEVVERREAEVVRASAAQALRDQLAAGVASIRAARDAAEQDQAQAEALLVLALDAKASTVTQRQTVAAFTPAASYSATQLGQVRNAIVDVLARVEEIQQALADFYAYRVAVDRNAVITDDALLWLARLASGALDDA